MAFDLVVLTPGVAQNEGISLPDDAREYLLLNPVDQEKFINSQKLRTLTEFDFLTPGDSEYNQKAKEMANDWCRSLHNEARCNQESIFLGDVPFRSMVYFFTGVVKAALLLERAAKRYAGKKWLIIEDGSYWSILARELAQKNGIRFESQKISSPQKASPALKSSWKPLFIIAARIIQGLASFFRSPHKGGLVVSGAFRFVLPWMDGQRIVYLRSEFDLRNFKKYFLKNTKHVVITAGNFHKKSLLREKLVRVFENQQFVFNGIDLAKVVRDELIEMSSRQISEAEELIPQFQKFVEKHRPKAVIFDEEVCVFNKTLAKVCRSRNIPIFCMLHGVPFFDVSFMPSACDKVLVWGESTRRRLLEWGMALDQIAISGAPQYENWHLASKPELPAAASGSLHLLMATQPFHTNQDPDFIGSFLTEQLIVDSVRFCAEFLRRDPSARLTIKLHPRDVYVDWNRELLKSLPEEMQSRILLLQKEDTRELILKSHIVLTMGSTVFYEALLLKRPVFILDYGARRQTSFMNDDYLDLENIEGQAALFQGNCRSPEWLDSVLRSQQSGIEYHFYRMNRDFRSEFAEILSQVIKDRKEEYVVS